MKAPPKVRDRAATHVEKPEPILSRSKRSSQDPVDIQIDPPSSNTPSGLRKVDTVTGAVTPDGEASTMGDVLRNRLTMEASARRKQDPDSRTNTH